MGRIGTRGRMVRIGKTCGAAVVVAVLAAGGCRQSARPEGGAPPVSPFDADLAFLRQHSEVVLLEDGSGARVAVAPTYQGRVMTSTTGGPDGPSFGWIGRAAIAAGTKQPHMNVFGGEDRFWLGPEGGKFALFFAPGNPFDLDHWQTPEPFDWGPWDISSQSSTQVTLRKHMSVVNYSGARFDLDVDRTVRLLTQGEAAKLIGASAGGPLRVVAFESSNTVVNAGTTAWQPETGLLSVWILGQFTPSPKTTIAIPFTPGPESTAGPVVNDRYFGAVPGDRLTTGDDVIFFKGDGESRGKIGLSPRRALDVAGSYDAVSGVLTLVQYSPSRGGTRYVNSVWDPGADPYAGDVINSYNDGPAAPGKPPLGPFYELETSSPALALGPGERYTHVHRTIHAKGPDADLDPVARATLRASLEQIRSALSSR